MAQRFLVSVGRHCNTYCRPRDEGPQGGGISSGVCWSAYTSGPCKLCCVSLAHPGRGRPGLALSVCPEEDGAYPSAPVRAALAEPARHGRACLVAVSRTGHQFRAGKSGARVLLAGTAGERTVPSACRLGTALDVRRSAHKRSATEAWVGGAASGTGQVPGDTAGERPVQSACCLCAALAARHTPQTSTLLHY
jgi:hypothetical protein